MAFVWCSVCVYGLCMVFYLCVWPLYAVLFVCMAFVCCSICVYGLCMLFCLDATEVRFSFNLTCDYKKACLEHCGINGVCADIITCTLVRPGAAGADGERWHTSQRQPPLLPRVCGQNHQDKGVSGVVFWKQSIYNLCFHFLLDF